MLMKQKSKTPEAKKKNWGCLGNQKELKGVAKMPVKADCMIFPSVFPLYNSINYIKPSLNFYYVDFCNRQQKTLQ
jgi:hypothetical protein